jgi:hypothetical protein
MLLLFACCCQVRDVREMRGGKPKTSKAKAAAEPELDFDDDEDYEQDYEAYDDQVRLACC